MSSTFCTNAPFFDLGLLFRYDLLRILAGGSDTLQDRLNFGCEIDIPIISSPVVRRSTHLLSKRSLMFSRSSFISYIASDMLSNSCLDLSILLSINQIPKMIITKPPMIKD